jgi:hypothetical protein
MRWWQVGTPLANPLLHGVREDAAERPALPVRDAARQPGLTAGRERGVRVGERQVRPALSRSRYRGGSAGRRPRADHGGSTGQRRDAQFHTARSGCRSSLSPRPDAREIERSTSRSSAAFPAAMRACLMRWGASKAVRLFGSCSQGAGRPSTRRGRDGQRGAARRRVAVAKRPAAERRWDRLDPCAELPPGEASFASLSLSGHGSLTGSPP